MVYLEFVKMAREFLAKPHADAFQVEVHLVTLLEQAYQRGMADEQSGHRNPWVPRQEIAPVKPEDRELKSKDGL